MKHPKKPRPTEGTRRQSQTTYSMHVYGNQTARNLAVSVWAARVDGYGFVELEVSTSVEHVVRVSLYRGDIENLKAMCEDILQSWDTKESK